MLLPVIEGVIRRRILVNFRANPEVIQTILPSKFKPKTHKNYAIVGICLIRLEHIRPKMFPEFIGLNSENAAHRIAVFWEEDGHTKEGVFIPRRDTDSQISHLFGGTIFPGQHHKSEFKVDDKDGKINFLMESEDNKTTIKVIGKETNQLPENSIFQSLSESSLFFQKGSLGYSVTKESNRLDGLKLETKEWIVKPLEILEARSSYFENEKKFPKGSIEFDHALLMRNIAHEWHVVSDLYF